LKLSETAKTRRDDAQKEWAEVYRQRIAFRQYTDQQQAAYGFDFDTGAMPGFKPTIFDAIVVVWAAVVFVVAVRLGRQVRRVAIRSRRSCAAARPKCASGCAAPRFKRGSPIGWRKSPRPSATSSPPIASNSAS